MQEQVQARLGEHSRKVVEDNLEEALALAYLDLEARSRKVVGDSLEGAFALGEHTRRVVGDNRKVVEDNHRVVGDSRNLGEAFVLGVQTLGSPYSPYQRRMHRRDQRPYQDQYPHP